MSEDKKSFFETNRDVLSIAVLSAMVLAIYWQTTGFGFINLDDNQYVFENPAVLSGLNWATVKWAFTAFFAANWHPLTWLSHMIDVQLFGLNAGAHHAVNIIIHLINSILAYFVFKRMTGCFWRSVIVAALFAVHPTHVESVAWIAERKDVLSTMFWLLTMFAYVRYAEGRSAETAGVANIFSRYGSPSYLFVAALFALGLLSKPMLVTLPFVLVLMDIWPLKRVDSLKDLPGLLVEKIPLFALSGVSSYLTVLAQRSGGAVESLDYLPLDVRMLNSLTAYAKYIVTMFYPVNLAIMYPYDRNFAAWQIAGAVFLLAVVTALCVWQFRTRKYLLFGWLWFLGTLVPVIGLVQVGSQPLADRYTYVPYFGLFVMIVWGLGDLIKKSKAGKALYAGSFAAAIVILLILSSRQVSVWKDDDTVNRHALAVTRDNVLILHNMCYELTLENRLDEAEPYCRSAIAIRPEFYAGHNTLGILQIKRKQYVDAEESFRQVVAGRRNFSLGYANLALALALQKRPEEAEQNLEMAVRLDKGSVKNDVWITALNATALGYSQAGNFQKAAENLTRVLALDGNNADARGNLAFSLYRLQRVKEAQQMIESAIQLNPNQPVAYNTYGLILLEQGRNADAAAAFEKALAMDPAFEDANVNLRKARGQK